MTAAYRILDIETVPDLDVWTPPSPKFELRGTAEGFVVGGFRYPGEANEVYAAGASMVEPFPPPHAQRVVAISWVDLVNDEESQLWSGYRGDFNVFCGWDKKDPDKAEREIIGAFLDAHSGPNLPTLVTWNGRGFDLPVLSMRALKLGLPFNFYYSDRDVRYRYSDNGHCDLMDFFSDYGAARNMKLGDVARLIGLPGKVGEVSGGNVHEMWKKGDDKELFAKVGRYCLMDVLQTAILFVRSRYHKGVLTAADYHRALLSFADNELVSSILGKDLFKKCRLVDEPTVVREGVGSYRVVL